MKRLIAATLAAGMLAVVSASSALAAEPTVDQIYAAARGGHLDQAQQMISEVLEAHPQSWRAHYVQAELYAREGNFSQARSELGTAERLKPGLPDVSPRSVQELRSELGLATPHRLAGQPTYGEPRSAGHFPWGALLVIVGAIALLFMLFRRRTTYPVASPGMGPGPGGAYGPGYGPGYGPAPMGGSGIGSGIAGGLASGLAVGAGVVAGEEIAHHFLDGRSSGGVVPPAEAADSDFSNRDMGGDDFGMSDSGGGWDDGGGFDGGGGGGDWS